MIPNINKKVMRKAFPKPDINSGKSILNPMEKKAILYSRRSLIFEKLAEKFVSIDSSKSTNSSSSSSTGSKVVATPKTQSLQTTSPTSFNNDASVRMKTVSTTSKV